MELLAQLGVTEKWRRMLPTLLSREQLYTEKQLDDVLDAHLPKQGDTLRKHARVSPGDCDLPNPDRLPGGQAVTV